MNDREPRSDRTTGRVPRLVIGGVVLFALLAVVSLASRSGFGHTSQASASPEYLSWAFSAFLVLYVLAMPALVWALYQQGVQAVIQRRSFKNIVIRRFISVMLFCTLIGGALYFREHVHWRKADSTVVNGAPKGVARDKAAQRNVAEPAFQWSVAAAFAGIILIASVPLTRAYLTERRLRQQRTAEQTLRHREQLAASIDVIVDDLINEPDPRRAVIAAYARMEALFTHAGVNRQENETAREYLRRLVVRMTGHTDAVEALTLLFERARFGARDISSGMKSSAIAALRQIREDLVARSSWGQSSAMTPDAPTGDSRVL
jgi:hypothetical protein